MKTSVRLIEISGSRLVSQEQDAQFLFEFQRSILLALKEQGLLAEIPFQIAVERLRVRSCLNHR